MSFDPKSATHHGFRGICFMRPTVSAAIKIDVETLCDCINENIGVYNVNNTAAVPDTKQDVDNGNRKSALEAAIANEYTTEDKGKVKQETVDLKLPLNLITGRELFGKASEWQGNTFDAPPPKGIEQLEITGNLAWGISKTKVKIGGDDHEFLQTNFYKVWEIAVGNKEKTLYTPQKQERQYAGSFGAMFKKVNETATGP